MEDIPPAPGQRIKSEEGHVSMADIPPVPAGLAQVADPLVKREDGHVADPEAAASPQAKEPRVKDESHDSKVSPLASAAARNPPLPKMKKIIFICGERRVERWIHDRPASRASPPRAPSPPPPGPVSCASLSRETEQGLLWLGRAAHRAVGARTRRRWRTATASRDAAAALFATCPCAASAFAAQAAPAASALHAAAPSVAGTGAKVDQVYRSAGRGGPCEPVGEPPERGGVSRGRGRFCWHGEARIFSVWQSSWGHVFRS